MLNGEMTTFANGMMIIDIFQSNFWQLVLRLTKVCTVRSDKVVKWQVTFNSDKWKKPPVEEVLEPLTVRNWVNKPRQHPCSTWPVSSTLFQTINYLRQDNRIIAALWTSILILCSPGSVSGLCWAKSPSETRFGLRPLAAIHHMLEVGSKSLGKTVV